MSPAGDSREVLAGGWHRVGIGSPECHHHSVSPYGCCACSTALPGGVPLWVLGPQMGSVSPGWHGREWPFAGAGYPGGTAEGWVLGWHCPSGCWVPGVPLGVPIWVPHPLGVTATGIAQMGAGALGCHCWGCPPMGTGSPLRHPRAVPTLGAPRGHLAAGGEELQLLDAEVQPRRGGLPQDEAQRRHLLHVAQHLRGDSGRQAGGGRPGAAACAGRTWERRSEK